MFQRGGLFGSLTVRQNVGLPLREHSALDDALIDQIAEWKLALTGLPPDAGLKLPDELSGGMLKRAALARAMALDPELLFLDEPTSGLDPASAAGVDELILRTQRSCSDPTIVVVSHDLDLLWRVCDRVAVLGEGHVLALGTMEALSHAPAPVVRPTSPTHGAAQRPRATPMDDKVNYPLVGAFVLVLGALLVAAVLWLAAGLGAGSDGRPTRR
jgi:phospholipid/cholesterol/gamma-HCH transport system ATP-binding protein